MLTVAKNLRQSIAQKRIELELLEKQIAAIVKHCDHKWGEIEFTPIPKNIAQWSRICKNLWTRSNHRTDKRQRNPWNNNHL